MRFEASRFNIYFCLLIRLTFGFGTALGANGFGLRAHHAANDEIRHQRQKDKARNTNRGWKGRHGRVAFLLLFFASTRELLWLIALPVNRFQTEKLPRNIALLWQYLVHLSRFDEITNGRGRIDASLHVKVML